MPRRRRAQKEENLWSPLTKWLLLFVKSELGTAFNSTAYGQGAIFPDIHFDSTTSELRIGVKRSIRDECAVQIIQVAAGLQQGSGFPILEAVVTDTRNSLHAVFAPQSLNELQYLGPIDSLPTKLRKANVSIRSFEIIVSAQKPKEQWITLEIDSFEFLGSARPESGLVREHCPVNKYSFVADAIHQLPGLGLGSPDGELEIILSQLAYEGSSDEDVAAEMVETGSQLSSQDYSTPLMSQAPFATPNIYKAVPNPNSRQAGEIHPPTTKAHVKNSSHISIQDDGSDDSEEFGSQAGSPPIQHDAGLLALLGNRAAKSAGKDQNTGTNLLNKLMGTKSKEAGMKQSENDTTDLEPTSSRSKRKRSIDDTGALRIERQDNIAAYEMVQDDIPPPHSPTPDKDNLEFQPYDVDVSVPDVAHVLPSAHHTPASPDLASDLAKRGRTIPSWLGVTRVTRRLFCVPSNQRLLLDRQQSWMPPEKGSRFPEANIPEEILKDVLRKYEQSRKPELPDPRESLPAPETDSDDGESSSADEHASDSDSEMLSPVNGSACDVDVAQTSSPCETLPWESSPPRPIARGIDAEMPPDSSLDRTNIGTHGNFQPLESADGKSPQKMPTRSLTEVETMDVDDSIVDEILANMPSSPPVDPHEGNGMFKSQHSRVRHDLNNVQVQETPYAKNKASDLLITTSQSKVSPQKQNSSGKTTSTTMIPCTYQDREESAKTSANLKPQVPEQPESSRRDEPDPDPTSSVFVPAKRAPLSPHASEKRSRKHRKIRSTLNFADEDPVPRNPSLRVLQNRQAYIENLKKQEASNETTAQTKNSTSHSLIEDYRAKTTQERPHPINPGKHHHLSNSPQSKVHTPTKTLPHGAKVSYRNEAEQAIPRDHMLAQTTISPKEPMAAPILSVQPQRNEHFHSQITSSLPKMRSQPQKTQVPALRVHESEGGKSSVNPMRTSIRPKKAVAEKETKSKPHNQPVKRSWHEDANTPFKLFAGRYARIKSFEGRMSHSARDGDPIQRAKTSLDVLAWPLGPPGGAK